MFDERQIETHRKHLIIEKRTSLASITEKSFEEDQQFIFYNIFDRRSVSFSRAHNDMRKKTLFVCRISKMMIWQTTHWWILVEFERSCSLIATSYHANAETKRLTQKRTENTVNAINKKTLSKTRQTSYRDTSRTSCSDERWIETHWEHSIIEDRTSLASITKKFLEED
jgi:hypothetical protein